MKSVQLEQDKVAAIIGFVKTKFPSVSQRQIKEKMGYKCRDAQRAKVLTRVRPTPLLVLITVLHCKFRV